MCFGFASPCPGWCPVPALPSSRKPSGCQRNPPRRTPAAKQIPSAKLLPIYSTEAAFQGAPGESNQIESLFALQASYLYPPCSEETLQEPDSEVNGMTKRGHCLLQFKLRSGTPWPGPLQCMCPQGADCGRGSEPEPSRILPSSCLQKPKNQEPNAGAGEVGDESMRPAEGRIPGCISILTARGQ